MNADSLCTGHKSLSIAFDQSDTTVEWVLPIIEYTLKAHGEGGRDGRLLVRRGSGRVALDEVGWYLHLYSDLMGPIDG